MTDEPKGWRLDELRQELSAIGITTLPALMDFYSERVRGAARAGARNPYIQWQRERHLIGQMAKEAGIDPYPALMKIDLEVRKVIHSRTRPSSSA